MERAKASEQQFFVHFGWQRLRTDLGTSHQAALVTCSWMLLVVTQTVSNNLLPLMSFRLKLIHGRFSRSSERTSAR